MKDSNIEALFGLPIRELKSLTFCKSDRKSLEKWVTSLPVTDAKKATQMLSHAINEICSLNTSHTHRMELLQILRPVINLICHGLDKSFSNQPIILADKTRKIADICQSIQMNLVTAYIISSCQCMSKMDSLFGKPTQLMSQAIFYALIENNAVLVRNYLLYRPIPPEFWINIHRLYQLALKYNLQNLAQNNDEQKTNPTSTIQHSYMQLLLWGCIKANQLRQEEIVRLVSHVWDLSRTIKLVANDPYQDTAFIIDPTRDTPPMYQKFYTGEHPANCQSLYVDDLVNKLKQLSAALAQKQTGISPALVKHLMSAWAIFTDRAFLRLDNKSQLTLAIGFTSTHYFIGEKKPFSEFIYNANTPRKTNNSTAQFKEKLRRDQTLDAWDQSLHGTASKSDAQVGMEAIDFHRGNEDETVINVSTFDTDSYDEFDLENEKFLNYRIEMVNMSPGGYCLKWVKDIPSMVKAGEIICVKEDHRDNWNIGSIRWVKLNDDQSIQVGVELLSPNAISYGARISDSEGKPKSDFMRVMVLPEIKMAEKPNTIITPTVAFKSGQHVLLTREGKEHQIELKKMLASTGSYFQFYFEVVKSTTPIQKAKGLLF